MSSSSTIRASSPRQNVEEHAWNLRLPSPALVVGLLLTCVFLLRLPAALVPREFNVDESQLLSEAMKFLVDPRPWKGVESCGPLNSYLLSIFLLLGFKPGYILAHIVASLLVCLQVLMGYLTLRRLGSAMTAAFGGFLMVFLYGTYTHTLYLHYCTAYLPTLFLMVGFYLFLTWLDEVPMRTPGVQLLLLFLGGLALGAAPWCKLQALPITGALGVLFLAAIFRARPQFMTPLRRVAEVAAFVCGALSTTCLILTVVAKSGVMTDFWYSYIVAPLAFVAGLSLGTSLENLARLILTTPVHQLLLVALLGLALLDYVSPTGEIRRRFKGKEWAYSGLAVYAASALFTACRSNNFWVHHAIFFIPPMTYLAAILAVSGGTALLQRRNVQGSRTGILLGLVGPVFLLIATVALYVAYGVRYVQKVKVIQQAYHMQLDSRLDTARNSALTKDGSVHPEDIFACCIGSRHWDLPQHGTERIAAVVGDIQKTRQVQSLAVWGWSPGVYVLTNIPPATRDTITERAIDKGPLQHYFQARFVRDLQTNPPDLFVDTVVKGAFLWRTWTENDGYESDPELRKFVDDNYILVDELTLINGTKPVRFFARREPAIGRSDRRGAH